MLSPFRWTKAIASAATSVIPALFVRSDFSLSNNASVFAQLEKCPRKNSTRSSRRRVRFSSTERRNSCRGDSLTRQLYRWCSGGRVGRGYRTSDIGQPRLDITQRVERQRNAG